jgi:outer membrane protein assembly factor BamC
MLQGLMMKLGGEQAQVKTPEGELIVAPKLQDAADGGKVIVLSEPFDKSWRKVAQALERANITVTDKDRANGTFLLRAGDVVAEKSVMDKLAFWHNDDAKKIARYQVLVKATDAGCVVTLKGDGGNTPDTQRALERVFDSLNK